MTNRTISQAKQSWLHQALSPIRPRLTTLRLIRNPICRTCCDLLPGLAVFALALTIVLAGSTGDWAASSAFSPQAIESAGVLSLAPYERLSATAAPAVSDRQIALVMLALMFSLISAVVMRSTRHLRRVIASPRRSDWRGSLPLK